MKSRWSVLWLVLLIALTVNFAVGMKLGMRQPMVSDAQFYLMIAQSLAEGHGFFLREGFWPDVPTMTRSPAWPFTVSLALRVCHGVSPDLIMRVVALTLNSLVAVLVAMLTMRVVGKNPESRIQSPEWTGKRFFQRRSSVGFIAAMIYVLHPKALFFAHGGASEILFLVLALSGTILLLKEPQVPVVRGGVRVTCCDAIGILLLGLSCLARPNFLLFIGFFGLIVIGYWLFNIGGGTKVNGYKLKVIGDTNNQEPVTTNCLSPRTATYCLLLTVLFLTPSLLWAVRNYQICGHFPVLSTLRGQTFYGGNNVVVARDREQWGYWVFPNLIPGETSMVELSKHMSEYEVDSYYNKKGVEFIHAHLYEMPRLYLGKMIRAYWPLPWKPSIGAYVYGAYRALLFVGAIFGVIAGCRRLSPAYGAVMVAMVLANISTVIVFWGSPRFAFTVEPFLIPLAVIPVMLLQEKYLARRDRGSL